MTGEQTVLNQDIVFIDWASSQRRAEVSKRPFASRDYQACCPVAAPALGKAERMNRGLVDTRLMRSPTNQVVAILCRGVRATYHMGTDGVERE